MNRVYDLYKSLLKEFGRQYWWPAQTRFEVIVGAILTQNTSWKNVEKVIANLKKFNLLNPEKILKVKNLKNFIRPAGFFNQKTQRLKLITKWFLENEKKAENMERLILRKELLAIKGIGKETADSIILYAFEKPIFVIDSYTKKFCKYYNLFKGKEYDDYRLFFEQNLPFNVEIFKEYHALIVAWGKNYKTKLI